MLSFQEVGKKVPLKVVRYLAALNPQEAATVAKIQHQTSVVRGSMWISLKASSKRQAELQAKRYGFRIFEKRLDIIRRSQEEKTWWVRVHVD